MRILLLLFVLLVSFNAHAQTAATAPQAAPAIEVVVPAFVTAGQEFSLIYRATPKVNLRLQKEFQLKSKEGRMGRGSITSPIFTAPSWVHKALIEAPGYYLLTFQFETQNGQRLTANARTKVLDAAATPTFAGTVWELPRKNVYLAPEKFDSWNQAPTDKPEILALERAAFSPLLEQPDWDDSWYPLRAWNEMATIFAPRFLPPLAFVRAFQNTSRLPVKYVAYATWSQTGANFIYQTEIGGKSWLYIETPASKPPIDLKTIFQPALLQPSAQSSTVSRSLLARPLQRFRALNPDSTPEAVQVWLVQIESPDGLNLLFPGYNAPEKPRFGSRNESGIED